ncbi:GntR family transcriptional regulator [Actinorugispora endophytica]|uniref:UTRA domain-containing protein n=1 Tax=Actinorugispora endophytica TaxID=1605990 RepID=A0A4R6V8T7_9ACTN|nr:UTRA domain-containing protein [Actinorugispora endophytica]TDQ55188.1 UTRA domain-containing protein [Actinorugispora endophytica]
MDARTLHDIAAITDPLDRARAASSAMTTLQGQSVELSRIRRAAIIEAQQSGLRQEDIARHLGVTPGRVSQMKKAGAADHQAPAGPTEPRPRILVQRALPTPPATRGSRSLYLTEAAQQGLEPERKMLYVGREPASEHVAAGLRVEAGEDVIARRKMFWANTVPVRISTSYFRVDVAEGTRLDGDGFVLPTLQAAIEEMGHVFSHATETLTARPPTPYEADLLDVPGEWVVQVLRVSYSMDDAPIHALETVCAASRHVFPIGQVAGSDQF